MNEEVCGPVITGELFLVGTIIDPGNGARALLKLQQVFTLRTVADHQEGKLAGSKLFLKQAERSK